MDARGERDRRRRRRRRWRAAFAHNFEELWRAREVERQPAARTRARLEAATQVRPWFCPGRGAELSHRIAAAIGRARRARADRLAGASPPAPILGTLAEVVAEGRVDLRGVVDATQIDAGLRPVGTNGTPAWKIPLLARVLGRRDFAGKPSTP